MQTGSLMAISCMSTATCDEYAAPLIFE